MWVRGLKLHFFLMPLKLRRVAPYVGAWIETYDYDENGELLYVAPYVGAWIETDSNILQTGPALSRTLCGCVD